MTKSDATLKPNLAEFEAKLPPRGCSISKLPLTDQQRVDLDAALAAGHIDALTIVAVVNGWANVHGEPMTRNKIQHHRERKCSCFTPRRSRRRMPS